MTAEVPKLSFPENDSRYSLIKTILVTGAFDPTPRLSSAGIKLPCFVDISCALSKDPNFLELAVSEFKKTIVREQIDYDVFCGVIRGGVPFAKRLAENLGVPWVARLGLKNDEERQKMVHDEPFLGLEVIIVDDIETTGLNATLAKSGFEIKGLNPRQVLYIMSYELEIAKRNLAKSNLTSHHLFTINDLVTVGLKNRFISMEDSLRINDWQKEQNSILDTSFIAKPT